MAELLSALPLLNGRASKQSKHPEPRLLPFVCLLLPLLLGKGDADLNVASGQKATFCDRTARLLELTDGNKEEPLSFNNHECNQRIYFSVFLGTVATVHFTSVQLEESDVEQSPNVLVKLGFQKDKDDETALQTCGELADGFSITKIIINCIWHPFGFDMVMVIFPTSRQVVINEIEVWSIGDQKHKNVTVIHRGCFLNFDISFIMSDLPDVSNCFEQCAGRSFTFAALAIGKKKSILKEACFCSNTFPEDEVFPSMCDIPCGSRMDTCGTKDRFSVYLVKLHLPAYLGCLGNLKIEFRRKKSGTDIASCLEKCNSYRYSYLQAGTICYCDDDLWEGPLTGNCNEPCENSPDQVCGGQTAASVYSTCLYSIEGVKCPLLFKCNGRSDELGMCTGGCLSGYIGLHCLLRSPAALTGNEIIDTASSRPDYINLDYTPIQVKSTKIRFLTKSKKFLNTLTIPWKDATEFRKSTASQAKKKYTDRKSTASQEEEKDTARKTTSSQAEDNDMDMQAIDKETVMVANIDINVTSHGNATSFDEFQPIKVADGESTSWLPLVILSAIAISAGFGFIAYKKFPKKKKVETDAPKKENSQNASKTTTQRSKDLVD